MTEKINLWRRVVGFFNANFWLTTLIITRQRLITEFGKGSELTIDCYRNYLTQAGYLKIIDKGKYKILKNIPADIPLSKVRKQAYSNESLTKQEIRDMHERRWTQQ